MNSVGPITLCCGSMWFQKFKDSEHSGSGKDNWVSQRFSPKQSELFNQELLCSLLIFFAHILPIKEEKGVFLSNSSLCNFSPVNDVGILMLPIEREWRQTSACCSSLTWQLLRELTLCGGARQGFAEALGVITGRFLGAAASGCCFCHPVFPMVLWPAGPSCALCSRQQGLHSICAFLSARRRVPCHCTSLTWAIALLSAYRGRK